jgi:hypothetical protein
MEKRITVLVEAQMARFLEEACQKPPADCGRDETLFDHEVRVGDGVRAVLQVVAPNSPEETAWAQCVLFDDDGYEIGVSEVGDSLLGEWTMEAHGDTYVINVVSA